MATAKAAHVHPRAVLWLWRLTRIWENRTGVCIAPFILVMAQSILQGNKWDTVSTGSIQEDWEDTRCLVDDTVFRKAELDLLRKLMVTRNTVVIVFSFLLLLPLSLIPTKDAIGFLTLEFLTHYLKTTDFFFSLHLFFWASSMIWVLDLKTKCLLNLNHTVSNALI